MGPKEVLWFFLDQCNLKETEYFELEQKRMMLQWYFRNHQVYKNVNILFEKRALESFDPEGPPKELAPQGSFHYAQLFRHSEASITMYMVGGSQLLTADLSKVCIMLVLPLRRLQELCGHRESHPNFKKRPDTRQEAVEEQYMKLQDEVPDGMET